jgi:hypothetical protein
VQISVYIHEIIVKAIIVIDKPSCLLQVGRVTQRVFQFDVDFIQVKKTPNKVSKHHKCLISVSVYRNVGFDEIPMHSQWQNADKTDT